MRNSFENHLYWLLLLFFCASALGQVHEAKRCVYREGDDPAWVQADHDDNEWTETARLSRNTTPPGPHLWMRCRIIAEPLDPGAELFVQDTNLAARQVFVNGLEAGSFGYMVTGRYRLDSDRSGSFQGRRAGLLCYGFLRTS